jgi:hypothetical protein
MDLKDLSEKVGGLLEKEPKLIQLPSRGKVVFVGDTHGDLDATERVFSRFLKKTNTLVFLGDYVDRGDFSKENMDYLLQTKCDHPGELILLAGNHEGYLPKSFSPANFWEALSVQEQELYGTLFAKFPLAVTSGNGILALHGGLPDLGALERINRIQWGDDQWDRILWGDFVESDEEFPGNWGGRPQFGRFYFEQMMDRYGKRVLVRSHQPRAPLYMFNKRCITIFTSYAYMEDRQVAIVDLEKEIRTAEEVTLQEI